MANHKQTHSLHVAKEKLEKLRAICSEISINSTEFKQTVRPLLEKLCAKKTRNFPWKLCVSAGVVLVISLLISCSTVQELLLVQSRMLMIKMRPHWDWENSHYRLCLIENPLFFSSDPSFTEESCETCTGSKGVDRVSNLSQQEALNVYLGKDRPVIVTDAIMSWTRIGTIFDLLEVLQDEVTSASMLCDLRTNLKWYNNISLLFDKMGDLSVKKWFAQWENCDKAAAKSIRKFYKRPYFLPIMVDNTNNNWVVVSSQYTGSVYKKIPASADVTWIAQIYGSSYLNFKPRSECHAFCSGMSVNLKAGEIALVPDFLWELSYLPGTGTENLAIGVSGFVEV